MTTKPDGALTTWTQTGSAPSLWEGEGPSSRWLVWEVPEIDGEERPCPTALIRWTKGAAGPAAPVTMHPGPKDAMNFAESSERERLLAAP